MGKATISPDDLEDAMRNALQSFFPSRTDGPTGNSRQEFYDKFQREANGHDNDFTEKYDSDLDTTLIFAGLFSAVTSAFIVAIQTNLQPDYTQLSYGILQIIANNTNTTHTQTGPFAPFPQWTGPSPDVIRVQATLYASLAATLLAAFIAMLGKQWLKRYSQMEMRGSAVDRCRYRQRKMDGVDTWHFDLVMESLPMMLQAGLLLLGYGLSDYLFSINKVVAGVTIGFTASGALFYLFIVFAAILSYNCPFQTPPSRIVRWLFRLDKDRKKRPKRTGKRLERIFSPKKQPATNGNNQGGHIALQVINPPDQLPPLLFEKETDWDGYVLDSKCITRMFHMSTDADATTAIMRFIPEVVWYAGIRTTPLERLYETVIECFDQSSDHPVVIPKLKEKAYLSAKALVHLAIQRKCIGNDSDKVVFESISNRHLIMGSEHCKGNSDLESTLGIADRVFTVPQPTPPGHTQTKPKQPQPMRWKDFTFSVGHHAWMGHILLYRAWDAIRKGEPLPDDTKEFVLHTLRSESSPSAPIVTDCLLIIGLVLGIELRIDDLLVADKSPKLDLQIDRIFEKLTKTFENPFPDIYKINLALKAMELITPLSENVIAQKSYDLFRAVMQVPVSPAYSEEKKWKASRLTMHGAYKRNESLPPVGDPRGILTFLGYHFDLAVKGGESQDEPIQDALCALAYASDPTAIEALKDFDPKNPSFIRGICYAYQDKRRPELRKAALFFLPLISDKMFNTPEPIIEPDEMKSFCADWASTVDSLELIPNVQEAALTVLFGMINSPHWRPHIVPEKWKLLEYFTLIPDDSQPLRRCINNPDLIEVTRNVGDQAASFLWLKILWLKYKELTPKVRTQMVDITRDFGQGRRRTDLDKYLATMDSESREAEEALTQYDTWSTDPKALALKAKIESFQEARSTLVALRRG